MTIPTRQAGGWLGPPLSRHLRTYPKRDRQVFGWQLRRQGVSVERIRRDRVLHEALTTGPDPRHLALVFNLSHTHRQPIRSHRPDLLDDQIEQATGQRPAGQRYASDEPTEIHGPQPPHTVGSPR